MNIVAIIGNITHDLKLNSGEKDGYAWNILNLSIAVNKYQKDKDDKVNYFKCVAGGNTAINIIKYFKKGSKIAITGELDTETYKNKETGANVNNTIIRVNKFDFVEKKNADNDSNNNYQAETTQVQPQVSNQQPQLDNAPNAGMQDDLTLEDLPF